MLLLKSIQHHVQVFNFTLWKSNLPNLTEAAFWGSVTMGPIFTILLGFCLMIISDLGFSFYLWYLNTSSDQSQSRLLNLLNGYLGVACMGCGLTAFSAIVMLTFPHADQTYLYQLNVRSGVAHVSVISVIFLLISVATILSHFKPSLYLEISLKWRNRVAIPVMFLISVLSENALRLPCITPETIAQCEVARLRSIVMIPATVTSFLCQLAVIIDDIWGWGNIFRVLRGWRPCKPSTVAPTNSEEPATHGNKNQFAVNLSLIYHYE